MTAIELYLKACYNITRCPCDNNNELLPCSKCPVTTKTACTMEIIAWIMVKGGVLYG